MNRFDCEETFIKGVYVVKAKPIEDFRGFYSRFFCTEEFKEIGFIKPVCQINHIKSIEKGTLRGLHYQKSPFGETKLIKCIKGRLFDVVVDVRKDSPTFLQHFSIELNDTNQTYLLIPTGIAHAFQTLEDNTEAIYLVDEVFHPESVEMLNPFDPKLNIQWPTAVTKIGQKEQNCKFIDESYKGDNPFIS